MTFAFGAILVVCLVGSVSMFTPNTMWNDFTYFFRTDKKEYLTFSNSFRGKYFLFIGIISLICFISSFFITYKVAPGLIFGMYIISLLIGRIILEIKWKNFIR